MVYTSGLMPRQRFYNLAPAARARMLGIATKHFAKHGFERASLNEILDEARISKGAYYYYFDDKEDLFATVLESAVDDMLARAPLPELGRIEPVAYWSTLERYVRQFAASFERSSDLFAAALQVSEAQRKSPRFAPLFAKSQSLYRALIEPGQRLGCIRTDLPVDALVRLLETVDAALDAIFASLHPQQLTAADLEAHTALVFDTFKRLLVTESPAPPPPPAPPPRRRRGRPR